MMTDIGKIVVYRLTQEDADKINRRRTTGESIAKRIAIENWPIGAQAHVGTPVREYDEFPMIVVRVGPFGLTFNGQVLLDGNDTYWVQNASPEDNSRESSGEIAGTWYWPS